MNSSVRNILEILNGAKSLRAVGFSSDYNFDAVRAEELLAEILQNTDLSVPIFSGILILEKDENDPHYTVVDGLQRITTICLLLCALCDNIRNSSQKNEDARHKIFTRYLTEQNEVKLKLAGKENNIYRKIIFSDNLTDEEKKSNLYTIYTLFFDKIQEKTISYSKLFKIIANIQFMTVLIPKSKIPLRELYQSINGEKDDSTQVKLITDFIEQISTEACELWQKTITEYEKDGLAHILKYFVRDFLSIQSNGTAPDETNLYKSFKVYCKKMLKYQNINQIITNMNKYSKYYLRILKSDFEDEEIQNQISTINENNGQDAYPYLMEVLDDMDNQNISREIFIELLTIINEFLSSRMNSPEIKMDFRSLSKELNKMIAQKTEAPGEKAQIDLAQINFIPKGAETGKNLNSKLTINEITQLSSFEV